MIKAVIVEDSELARLELATQLKDHPQINIIGEAEDVEGAVRMINDLSPDLVFMDIDLPGGNAFDILEKLTIVPQLIFTTAYDNFALDAFEHNTLDYLLKPIKADRLAKALDKLNIEVSKPDRQIYNDSQFFIKDGDKCWLVKVSDVKYMEAEGNYARIYFSNQSPLLYRSLNKIEERLDATKFFRASRQHLVNLQYVETIEPWTGGGLCLTLEGGTEIEVSRRQTSRFKQLMSL